MNTVKKVFLALIFLVVSTCNVASTGLYLNLPYHVGRLDSSRVLLTFHEAALSGASGESSFLYSEVSFGVKKYVSVRLGLSYVVIDGGGEVVDGVGDGFLYSTLRVMGDTLGVEGLFVRADLRIPVGSRGLYPFSYASLDGGLGIEGRYRFALFFLRASSTFYMCGDRVRQAGVELDNYLVSHVSLEFPLFSSTDFTFGLFSVVFRGGGAREVYQPSLRVNLSRSFCFRVGAALDAGGNEERVFDSQLFFSIDYRFPPLEKEETEKESTLPPQGLPSQTDSAKPGLK